MKEYVLSTEEMIAIIKSDLPVDERNRLDVDEFSLVEDEVQSVAEAFVLFDYIHTVKATGEDEFGTLQVVKWVAPGQYSVLEYRDSGIFIDTCYESEEVLEKVLTFINELGGLKAEERIEINSLVQKLMNS